MNAEEKKKPGRPALTEVYCLASLVATSKGPISHGDRIKLPKEEAERLISKGLAQ